MNLPTLSPMPEFVCRDCGAAFSLPQSVLDRYPGWTPGQCRDCRDGPKAAASKGGRAEAPPGGDPTSGVFTDGSSSPNPGPGGWGAVYVKENTIIDEAFGHGGDTTNNRMELTALIAAFRALPEAAEAVVYTDSRLCVDTITKWAPGWERKGWKRKGEPLKNLDLVKELLALFRKHPNCELEWIAAHAGHRWNEYADSLASAWRRDEL